MGFRLPYRRYQSAREGPASACGVLIMSRFSAWKALKLSDTVFRRHPKQVVGDYPAGTVLG